MDICIKELTERKLRMVVSGVTPAFMNTLRRIIVSDVPKMAIDTVEFHLGSSRDEEGAEYESISPLFDEIISHRLGLVPVPTDLSLFRAKEGCECAGEGCPLCEIMYSLNKRGPCTVYSGDLEPLGDPTLAIKEDLIPIVHLDKNQALLVYAIATLGTGRTHAKWMATTSVGYKYYPEIVPNDLSEKELNMIVEAAPVGFLAMKKGKVEIADFDKCEPGKYTLWEQGATGDSPTLMVNGRNDKFIFHLESDGAMSATAILKKALEIMEDKFEGFRQGIADIK